MAKSFAAQIRKFETDNLGPGGKAEQAARKIALDLFGGVIARSPVGNPELWAVNQGKKPGDPDWVSHVGAGRFRANWQVAVGEAPSGELDAQDKTPTGERGGATIAAMTATVSGLAIGQTLYLVNNLPYAIPLEEGHSTQAPAGMVGLEVQRFDQIVRAVAAELGDS